MVFSSYVFLFYFLPLVLLIYYPLPGRWKQPFLTLVSYVFYGWANPWFVFLMIFSTLNDYICGLMIAGQWNPVGTMEKPDELGYISSVRQRKVAVALSVITNLGLLGFFKYFNFGVENYDALAAFLGLPQLALAFKVTLPLGISFYSFQSMSYSIDLYRGHAKPAKNLLDFSCYVALFPQLVAGPIVRYSDLADQLSVRTHSVDKIARGLIFFIMGFAKKILLANAMGMIADTAFNTGSLRTVDAWYGIVAYAFQIYFDFSAYSDMAIGMGLMLGFRFPQNFDAPYISQSITEFWRRWHMSLSTFLRDYLYIPLGGNRKGTTRTYINLALTMILGGLWHGASWNFVIWGTIHGGMLVGERAMGKDSPYRRLPRPVKILITFAIVCVAWVFFRTDDLPEAARYIAAMFGFGGDAAGAALVGGTLYATENIVAMVVCGFIVWFCRQTWDHAQTVTWKKMLVLSVLMVWSAAVMCTQTFNPFIYFIF